MEPRALASDLIAHSPLLFEGGNVRNAALEQLPIPFTVLSRDGLILAASSAGGAWSAAAGGGYVGLHFTVPAPHTGERVCATVRDVFDTGETVSDQEIETVELGGRYVWRYTYFPIRGELGEVVAVGLIADEISGHVALVEQREIFHQLVSSSTDFIGLATPDGEPLYVNPAGRALVGLSASDPLLDTIAGYHTEQGAQIVFEQALVTAARGESWRGRCQLKHQLTGDPIEVDMTLFGVRDRHERLLCYATVMRDTSDRDRALRQLETQIECSPAAIVVTGPDLLITRWNPAAEQMLGWTQAEMLGKRVRDTIITPKRRGQAADSLRSVLEGRAVTGWVEPVLTRSGETKMAEWAIAAMLDQLGNFEGLVFMGQEVTARLRAEHDRGLALLSARTGTWTADTIEGRLAWSDEMFQLTGTDAASFAPSFEAWTELIHSDDRERVAGSLAQVRSGEPFALSYRIIRPSDAALRWLDVHGQHSPGSGQMMGTVRDVTEQREAEAQMRELEARHRELLEQMLRSEADERGRIAGALHDDTIQLMTALQFNLDRIGRAIDPSNAHALSLVEETRTALSRSIDRTRQLMFELRPQNFDEHGLHHAVTELVEQAAAESGFEWFVSVPKYRYPALVEELAYRTIREAVINVRRHAQATWLEVSIQDDQELLTGEVTDDGVGFDPEAVDRLRLHLGLDALRERVRLAGGQVAIQSTPGTGTCLRFQIPITRDRSSG